MKDDLDRFTVRTVESEEDLKRAYAFAVSVLGDPHETIHTQAYYLGVFQNTPGLLVYAEHGNQVIGSTFGSLDGDHVLVGMVAVAPSARRMGVGAALFQRLEVEASRLGQTTLLLGARQEAESFYLSCGFLPNLFIQLPEAGRLADLKGLNPGYPVAWEADEGGWSKLMLAVPQIDRDLQNEYERRFPACFTQYVFIKQIAD
jgi:GNAT superfamily N-acetyltransferase